MIGPAARKSARRPGPDAVYWLRRRTGAARGRAVPEAAVASEARLLTVQFLQWLAARPRTYAEVRDAWSSTCPLNCAWEDAVADGLVRHVTGGSIVLTERGRERLAQAN
jgi:hypothetical protein